jgi:hypothetical protein
MPRLLGAVLLGASVAVGACGPTPSAMPSAMSSFSADAATLTINGSGELCGPWWFGCGAALVVEPAGWELQETWVLGADDTRFAVDPRVATEEGALITGVAQEGRNQIEPGDYTVAAILTMQSDVATPPPSASLGCSVDMSIPRGTRAVTINVEFNVSHCAITVALDGRPS